MMTRRTLLLIAALVAGACAGPGSVVSTATERGSLQNDDTARVLAEETNETRAVMHRWIADVWHGGQLDLVPELVAPRYTRHEDEGSYTVTAAEYTEQIRNLRSRFPQLRYEIHDSAAVGDRFWIRYTFRGGPDSTGPWPKRPGLQVYRLESGKLAETWMLLRPGGTEWTDPVLPEEGEDTSASQPDTTAEVDDYWDEVSRTVSEGDFEGYAALYHEDAVLVNGISGRSYPIADALEGWRQGFEDTKAGRMTAGVEFRFSERIHGETTAHDTGIFRYFSQDEGGEMQSSYVHFQGLLVQKDGEWIMMMEYQMSAATQEEWEGLEQGG